MKILIVTEDVPVPKLGGAGKHAVLLGNALIEAGHEVELLGYLRPNVAKVNNGFVGKLHTKIDFSNTGLKSVALGIFNPIRQLLLAWRLWSAIKRLDYKAYDVIHYHGHIAELGVLVPQNINYVHTLHDQASECMTMLRFRNGGPCRLKSPFGCAGCATPKPNILQKTISATAVMLHRKMAKLAFTRHKTIFVSDFLLTRFKENVGGFNNLNATVVHNFTDIKTIKGLVYDAHTGKHTKFRPTILIVGRVHATKGQQAFLEAVPDSLLNNAEIRIAGDGPDLTKLKDKYEKRGIKFLGFLSQEDIYKETLLADACVVPSIWEEPFGATTLEALVLGKKVYSLNQGGTPELVRYCSYPNQLQLFDNITLLVNALSLLKQINSITPLNFRADVTKRLPEILNVYNTPAS